MSGTLDETPTPDVIKGTRITNVDHFLRPDFREALKQRDLENHDVSSLIWELQYDSSDIPDFGKNMWQLQRIQEVEDVYRSSANLLIGAILDSEAGFLEDDDYRDYIISYLTDFGISTLFDFYIVFDEHVLLNRDKHASIRGMMACKIFFQEMRQEAEKIISQEKEKREEFQESQIRTREIKKGIRTFVHFVGIVIAAVLVGGVIRAWIPDKEGNHRFDNEGVPGSVESVKDRIGVILEGEIVAKNTIPSSKH